MFAKGKIDILLPKTGFTYGDTITGTLALRLKKPVNARELVISLIGEQKTTSRAVVPGQTGTTSSTQTVKIYDFKLQLDTEKEYSGDRDYDFEIQIPGNMTGAGAQGLEMPGKLAQGLKMVHTAAAMMGKVPFQRIKWYLSARIDVRGGLNISKKADIVIS